MRRARHCRVRTPISHAAQQLSRRPRAENLDEAFAEMGVEIVQDQMNAPRPAVDALDQVSGEGHEVGLAAVLGHLDGAPSGLRTDGHEQVAGAVAHVLPVFALWRSGCIGSGSRLWASSWMLFSSTQTTGSSCRMGRA